MSQDNPGINQEITLVVVYILAYSGYSQYICDLRSDSWVISNLLRNITLIC